MTQHVICTGFTLEGGRQLLPGGRHFIHGGEGGGGGGGGGGGHMYL